MAILKSSSSKRVSVLVKGQKAERLQNVSVQPFRVMIRVTLYFLIIERLSNNDGNGNENVI